MKSPFPSIAARDRIIVALDVPSQREAVALVQLLSAEVSFFKIGLQLYTACGPDVVRAVADAGGKVFLDLKLHDIPNTVARAVESAAHLDVQMLTIHLSGGGEMIRAAVGSKAIGMMLLGVTVLTSADAETLREIGVESTIETQVLRLADLGARCGIDGLVASPHELPALRREFDSGIKLVIPGVRPGWSASDDQKRFLTPAVAVRSGANYLVIGRPITSHRDPREAVQKIIAEISA